MRALCVIKAKEKKFLQVVNSDVDQFPKVTDNLRHDPLPVNIAFPPEPKRLTLSGCRIVWKNMSIIGSLPKLEVLKLKDHTFEGLVWEPIEGEFGLLKFLLLEQTDLEHWNVDGTHFQSLERLNLRYCYNLVKIPSGFGEHLTLHAIELYECSPSVVGSAESIKEEQKDYGKDKFQIAAAIVPFEIWGTVSGVKMIQAAGLSRLKMTHPGLNPLRASSRVGQPTILARG
ncbi:putative late blight resistance proteinR1A-10 [Abeliophyllum distichum]|uniref:Late blight resistance proteinR1A-10 n=1 Tax=Abeliophyllum distichum TaxID=126358 RepID=A0ABD1RVB9_9LAMI